MRYFALKNEHGETYELTSTPKSGVGSVFFHEPKGLGFEVDGNMKKIGNSYFRENRTIKQKNITGTLYFRNPKAYMEYNNFVEFVNHDKIILIYAPNGKHRDNYEINVECSSLKKGELGSQGLYCDVVFKTLSPPRKPFYVESRSITADGKKYDYKYNYTYSNGDKNTLEINVDSNFQTPVELVIYGKAKNPKWKHYVNGKLETTGEVFAEIFSGNKLTIDSTLPYKIEQTDLAGNLVGNLYQASNFETKRFIFLKHGRNVITLSEDFGRDVQFYIVGGINYASV